MQQIGIFFGTETGTTRLVAKKIQARLGEAIAAKPLNVNRIEPAQLLAHDALILGTPSYGVGQIPGHSAGCLESNWEEFLAKMPADVTLRGQHDVLLGLGAEIIGGWPTEGYTFEQSAAVVEGRFVGLVIDQRTQGMLTDARLDAWVDQVRPLLLERLQQPQAA